MEGSNKKDKPPISFIIENPSAFVNRRAAQTNDIPSSHGLISNASTDPIILDEDRQLTDTASLKTQPYETEGNLHISRKHTLNTQPISLN